MCVLNSSDNTMKKNIRSQISELSTFKKIFLVVICCLPILSARTVVFGPSHTEFYKDFFENPGSYKSGGIYWGHNNKKEKIKDVDAEENQILSKCLSSLNRSSTNVGADKESKHYDITYTAISERYTYTFLVLMVPQLKEGWLGEQKVATEKEGSLFFEKPRGLKQFGGACIYDFFHLRHSIEKRK